MDRNKYLGLWAKDRITDFEGWVTGFCQYITGCDQYCLRPKAEGSELKEAHWFDANRLEFFPQRYIEIETGSNVHDNGPCESAPKK